MFRFYSSYVEFFRKLFLIFDFFIDICVFVRVNLNGVVYVFNLKENFFYFYIRIEWLFYNVLSFKFKGMFLLFFINLNYWIDVFFGFLCKYLGDFF